jgi:hypothetical protein
MAKAYGVDAGGVDGGAIEQCVNTMCATEVSTCQTESCTACEQPLGNCALQNCVFSQFDASLPKFDGSTDGGCDAPGPECAALASCCSLISAGAMTFMNATLKSYATMCTTNSQSCDEATCKATITAVNSIAMICTPP